MRAATLLEILAYRGRVVIFTPTAELGLKAEQLAERHHAQVITTRGWADPYGPLSTWQRMHSAREYALLSCNQTTYTTGYKLPCTDLVWVGDTGDQLHTAHLWQRFNQCMATGFNLDIDPRKWLVSPNGIC